MKKILVIVFFLSLFVVGQTNLSYADEPFIDKVEIQDNTVVAFTDGIGLTPTKLKAIVHMSDGTIPTDEKYKQFIWKIELRDNVNKTFSLIKTDEGEEIEFWLPYGSKAGYYRVTAIPKEDPDIWGEHWCYKDYFWMFPNYTYCAKGTVKYGEIMGEGL